MTTDVETLSQFFKWGGIAWVVNGLVIFAVLITMFFFNWKLALVAIATSAPLPFLLRVLQKRLDRGLRPVPGSRRGPADRGL